MSAVIPKGWFSPDVKPPFEKFDLIGRAFTDDEKESNFILMKLPGMDKPIEGWFNSKSGWDSFECEEDHLVIEYWRPRV